MYDVVVVHTSYMYIKHQIYPRLKISQNNAKELSSPPQPTSKVIQTIPYYRLFFHLSDRGSRMPRFQHFYTHLHPCLSLKLKHSTHIGFFCKKNKTPLLTFLSEHSALGTFSRFYNSKVLSQLGHFFRVNLGLFISHDPFIFDHIR